MSTIKVLVIDDVKLVRETIRRFLTHHNFVTIEAETGDEGIVLFKEDNPDLAIVDLSLPGINGREVVSRMVEMRPEIPVVVISGDSLLEDVVEVHRLGAWDFIAKPISYNSFYLVIDRVVDRSRLLRENREYQRHLEERVIERTSQLEKAMREKTGFLYDMSHELRTPLNSVMVLSELLIKNLEGNLSEAQVEYAATIHRSGNEMLKLIDDLLDIAKIDAGKVRPVLEEVNLEDILYEMEGQFDHIAEKRGVEFCTTISSRVPPSILSDQRRLAQILRNLISNAIKFTLKGSVTVRVDQPGDRHDDIWQSLDREHTIEISVEDTGIGISDGQKGQLFGEYQQADNMISKRFGGTGLGLLISRRLANMLGGDITYESVENKGSCFSLLLPHSPVYKHPIISESIRSARGRDLPTPLTETKWSPETTRSESLVALPGKRILIIDSDNRSVFNFRKLLQDKGAEVITVTSGLAAAQQIKDLPSLDLVLIEYDLPGLDSLGVIRNIRENRKYHHVPIITLGDTADSKKRKKSLAASANAYLAKSSTPQKFLSTINTVLAKDPAYS